MYKELIQSIKGTLEELDSVKAVYPYALREGEKVSSYPAVVFFADNSENSFETNADNFKIYRFSLFVICSTEGIGSEEVSTEILPNVVDDIVAKFDEDWSLGVTGSNRTWQLIDSGGAWTLPYTGSGVEMSAQLNLRIKLLSPINS